MTRRVSEAFGAKGVELCEAWRRAIIASYPAETAEILSRSSDRMANPLGFAISDMTDAVTRALAGGASDDDLSRAIAPFVRIRAVQGISASDAVSFVRLLRDILRGSGLDESPSVRESWVEALSDRLTDITFRLYAESREKLHEVRQEELKRNLYMLLRRANMLDVKDGPSGAG